MLNLCSIFCCSHDTKLYSTVKCSALSYFLSSAYCVSQLQQLSIQYVCMSVCLAVCLSACMYVLYVCMYVCRQAMFTCVKQASQLIYADMCKDHSAEIFLLPVGTLWSPYRTLVFIAPVTITISPLCKY